MLAQFLLPTFHWLSSGVCLAEYLLDILVFNWVKLDLLNPIDLNMPQVWCVPWVECVSFHREQFWRTSNSNTKYPNEAALKWVIKHLKQCWRTCNFNLKNHNQAAPLRIYSTQVMKSQTIIKHVSFPVNINNRMALLYTSSSYINTYFTIPNFEIYTMILIVI